MKQFTVEEALQIALKHHQAGQLKQAEAIYRQILGLVPNHADAMHLLGALALQVGRGDAALELVQNAIAINPAPEFYNTLANAHVDQKRPDEALANYRKAISLKPGYAEAHNNLGAMLAKMGQPDEAIASFRQAVLLNRNYVEAWINLGVSLGTQAKHDEAIEAFNTALSLQPSNARAYSNLANAQLSKGDIGASIYSAGRAINLQPDLAEAHANLAAALMRRGSVDKAIESYNKAIEVRPDFADAHNNLGTALVRQRKFPEAIAAYQKAVALKGDFADAWFNMGTTYREIWNLPRAIEAYNKAISLKPTDPLTYENLGEALKEGGQPDLAIDAFLKAIHLKPDASISYGNLGSVYKDQGRLDEALYYYKKAMTFDPASVSIHSNYVYTLWFHPDYDGARILSEIRNWAAIHAQLVSMNIRPHDNDRSPDRRLKIGYVSSDFREHPVGRFLLPLLPNHNPENVEVYCYAGVKTRDEITSRLEKSAHVWRDTVMWDDATLAEEVRKDRIDILIDLTLHMADSRLLAFAAKPAPVQVTYLGYAGTTGVETIDYRLGDPQLDPPGLSEKIYSEKTIRLPHTYWCYPAPDNSPDVSELPALKNGHITFGCFNNFCKITAPTIRAWVSLMESLPNSRLIVYSHPGSHRERFAQSFTLAGIDSSRIEFAPMVSMREYLERYNSIDIALDPFPYGGGTTTCDALWMGVPVVTLAGQTGVGRGGVTLLTNVGLPEFIAQDTAQYISIAQHWANDLPALATVRSSLRDRMKRSPLMDASAFAANVEAAYRTMWHEWCRNGSPAQ